MSATIEQHLQALEAEGNLRRIPAEAEGCGLVDFSSNDYLGLSRRTDLQKAFLERHDSSQRWLLGASASRLLASRQLEYDALEAAIEEAYPDRKALVFNSGYHANTGLIPALARPGTVLLADKLVHASIIDGMKLAGVPFERFRHNDANHLERLLAKAAAEGKVPLVLIESVYSMDGDRPDFEALTALKRRFPQMTLYVDEAHAIGVEGRGGLGLAQQYGDLADVIVGTFGKALASVGAYAAVSPAMREYLVNTARSLIFSTALPPLSILWNEFVFRHMQTMDSERAHLKELGAQLAAQLGTQPSHIQCRLVGDPRAAVEQSQQLRRQGMLVLPIRRPTVPPGTDRLRISLSAAHTSTQITALASALS